MRQLLFIIILISASFGGFAQTNQIIRYFKLCDVELLDGPFKHAQDLDKKYLLDLDADRLLAPFLKEAGLTPKAEYYTNWEKSGLSGHIGGHYLSALAQMAASTGDQEIVHRLEYMVSELKRAQDANGNGYIGGVPDSKRLWKEISQGKIDANGFRLNNGWVPLYNIHKTFAGLRDVYTNTGNETAKEMLVKMTDWMYNVVKDLSDEQIQEMLKSEHGGLNEVFADVADLTGNSKYLTLAKKFSDKRLLDPLLAHKDELTGKHANTQIPKVIGFKRIADLAHLEDWNNAAVAFWENVVYKRSVCIGGNSTGEHFNDINDFSRMMKSKEGPETCNTYNMLRLSKSLYATSADKRYIDFYERALYNHILSSQNPRTGGLVYFTQMRPGHYRTYSQPQTSMWCCVGSGIENHSKYGEMIYAYDDNSLFVNLFIPSKLTWADKNAEILQQTAFPKTDETELILNPTKKSDFTLKIRIPSWTNANGIRIMLNGKQIKYKTEGGYACLKRKWRSGDKVRVKFPMEITVEQLPDKSNFYAFMYGPVALAAKTNQNDLRGLFANDGRGGHGAPGKLVPFEKIPFVVSEPSDLSALVTREPGDCLRFSLTGLSDGSISTLEPFFNVHESRYIIYWPQANREEMAVIRAKMENEEKERLLLESRTIDMVTAGEQQPESDHDIRFDNSATGTESDIHWREAKGWFGYTLKNKDGEARIIHIKYFDREWKREAKIFINDQETGCLLADKGKNDEMKTIEFPLPDNATSSSDVHVTFKAVEGSVVPRIVEVRLAK